MRVYLVRHAHAVDAGPRLPDEARWLSKRGRKVSRKMGKRLAAEHVELDAVLTSPLVRAVQTAELLADAADYTGEIEALVALSPGVPARVAAGELAARGAAVAVVGHEPGISELGAFLLGRPAFPPFRKGQVAFIDRGRPVWTIDPDKLELERLLVG